MRCATRRCRAWWRRAPTTRCSCAKTQQARRRGTSSTRAGRRARAPTPRCALHVVATAAEACAAGAGVPAVVTPATIMATWDGVVRFTGFGRAPVAQGPLAEVAYVSAGAPAD